MNLHISVTRKGDRYPYWVALADGLLVKDDEVLVFQRGETHLFHRHQLANVEAHQAGKEVDTEPTMVIVHDIQLVEAPLGATGPAHPYTDSYTPAQYTLGEQS